VDHPEERHRVKIAYLVTRADPIGGAQIHVRDLAAAVEARGHAPTVLISGEGPFVDDLRARGIPVIILRHLVGPMRPLRDLRALGEVMATLRRLQPDLLTAHGAKVGILGRLAARRLNLPLVVTVHGWACAPGTPAIQAAVSRGLERLIGRFATKIITVSEFDRRFALDSRLASGSRLVTVHNGMPDVGQTLRADPGRTPPRLVMVGRFEPQKDHATLLRALGALQSHPWELDLVGDGPLRPEMESLAARLGVGQRIHFLGQRIDVDRLLAQAQIGVLVSNWEGFPLSILEAMRAGLPVVASDVGGVAEAVQNEATGYVVPRGDVGQLRERIATLLASPDLRIRLGTRGRARYEEHFTLDRMVARTLELYREVLQGRGASAESSDGPRVRDPQSNARAGDQLAMNG
jgi:glycosyltransferase involved in cell wall biosynthesis